jgi:hypothetical protein
VNDAIEDVVKTTKRKAVRRRAKSNGRGQRVLNCSFCSKSDDEVGPFAEGPGNVYICYACVRLCALIIEQMCKQGGRTLKLTHVSELNNDLEK